MKKIRIKSKNKLSRPSSSYSATKIGKKKSGRRTSYYKSKSTSHSLTNSLEETESDNVNYGEEFPENFQSELLSQLQNQNTFPKNDEDPMEELVYKTKRRCSETTAKHFIPPNLLSLNFEKGKHKLQKSISLENLPKCEINENHKICSSITVKKEVHRSEKQNSNGTSIEPETIVAKLERPTEVLSDTNMQVNRRFNTVSH